MTVPAFPPPIELATPGVADVTLAPVPPAMQPQPPARMHTTADGSTSPFPLFYDSCAKVYPPTAHSIIVYADGGGGPASCIGYPQDRDRYRIHRITREGGAHSAGNLILDYEWTLAAYAIQGAAREWAETRAAHGERFITYVPRALLHHLLVELGPVLFQHEQHRFFIPTLDGKQWTPAELAGNILRGWSVDIPAGKLWANQWSSGGPRGSGRLEWDESSLFLDW